MYGGPRRRPVVPKRRTGGQPGVSHSHRGGGGGKQEHSVFKQEEGAEVVDEKESVEGEGEVDGDGDVVRDPNPPPL